MESKNPTRRPNAGNHPRSPARSKRARFLETDVTDEEHQTIFNYCLENKISVSQFLADLVLEDAASRRDRTDAETRTVELTLSVDQFMKLELLAHLRQKRSVEELILDTIQPFFELQRLFTYTGTKAPTPTKVLRFYLSGHEHARASKHLSDCGVPARKYVSFLAMKKIAEARKEKR